MPQTLRPRNGRMKSQEPRARMVMNRTTDASAMTASRMRIWVALQRAGRAASAKFGPPPQQQPEEGRRAHDAEDGADGDFVGEADQPADNVAGQHEAGSGEADPRNGAAQIVAHDGADEIGHDEPEERDGAGGDDHH